MDGVGSRIAAGVEPARVVQNIAVGPTSNPSADMNETTKFIRVHTDTTIRIAFGKSPVAGATSQRMIANSTEYFGVTPGIQVAVIQSA